MGLYVPNDLVREFLNASLAGIWGMPSLGNSGESAALRRISLTPLIPFTKAFSVEFDILREISFKDLMIFRIVIRESLKKACGAHIVEQVVERIITHSERREGFVMKIEDLLEAELRRGFDRMEFDQKLWNRGLWHER